MAEIKINTSKLDDVIKRLGVLEKNWNANDTKPPVTVGGGKTVNELEELAAVYQNLNSHMAALASTTAAFLKGVKESYQESDQKAAKNITGK